MRHLKSMKLFMLMGILFISQLAVCQNTQWSSPICNRYSNSTGLIIKTVNFYSNATVIEFLYDNNFGNAGWVQLSQDCEIIAYPSRKTYKLTSATGIPYAPTKHYFSSSNEKLSFTCIFPAIPNGTTSIDWREEGEWVITGIRSQSGIPVDNSKGNKYISETWIMPEYSTLSENKGLELTEVEITNSQTVLWFTYTNHYDSNGWANIDRETKIVAYPSGKSLSLTKSKGLPIAPSRHNFSRRGEQLRFSLTFPALPQGTTKFNFIENHSSTWKLFDICPSSQGSLSNLERDRETKSINVNRVISTDYHTWTLKSIELSQSKTVCHWSVTPKVSGTYIQMTKGVYLIDDTGKRYYMTSCDGISLEPEKDAIYDTRTVNFTVTFPAVDPKAASLTYYSSPSFQIKNIDISQNRPTASEFLDLNTSETFNAYASCSCYIQANGEWSNFSEWQDCNIPITYDAIKQTITFDLSQRYTFNILKHDRPDPAIISLECRENTYGINCDIEFVTLPDNAGLQIYLTLEGERICYAIIDNGIDSSTKYEIIKKPVQNDNWQRYAQKGAIEQYNQGWEFERIGDYRSAFEQYRLSSNGGCELATVKLAYMYLEGKGVQKNTEIALSYIDKAITNFKERSLVYPLDKDYWYANALNAKGFICTSIGDWDEAMSIFIALTEMECDDMDDTPFFQAMQRYLEIK